ncbi:hypothetical protein FOQG_06926 [Fusarium oxysporum f. sp. raphani 54005]|uniref:Uncharacterized protein n=2 Tax=Fusarium oxysporum TaxID=5507 RepID=X0CHN8_FUSOX|nr:hypothetical protein FOVG_06122 [Fusarium oxysporum f. sp. pisi HDV247]EXK90773.1 hypothetical protein FOQG_06926 [Fusarium oxysporum f. sp. raphani 54005]
MLRQQALTSIDFSTVLFDNRRYFCLFPTHPQLDQHVEHMKECFVSLRCRPVSLELPPILFKIGCSKTWVSLKPSGRVLPCISRRPFPSFSTVPNTRTPVASIS